MKKGTKHSAETRRKMSAALKGHVVSAETRRKISEKTDAVGEKNGNHKLSTQDVVDIKLALRDPYYGLNADLARRYGVGNAIISHIKNRRAWTHIEIE